MTYSELSMALSRRGIASKEEIAFDSLYPISLCRGRLLCGCAEGLVGGNVLPIAPSCWIHDSPDISIVGLWSGRFFKVANRQRLADLLVELFAHFPHSVPTRIPRDIVGRYDVRELSSIALIPRIKIALACEKLCDVQADAGHGWVDCQTFIERLSAKDFICNITSNGAVSLSLGVAVATTRFPSNNEVMSKYLHLLMYDGIRGTPDHHVFFEKLCDCLNCVLFDLAWGNRIHLNDPYYAYNESENYPDEPMNLSYD